jgi:hypothetical protein
VIISCKSGQNGAVIDHHYFPALPEFTFTITDDLKMPSQTPITSPIRVKYVKTEMTTSSSGGKMAYFFETTSTSKKLYLLIPQIYTDNIRLAPGLIYDIFFELRYGWPSAYGLIISGDNGLVFSGITDWSADGVIKLSGRLPLKITQGGMLKNNYIEGEKDFVVRETNTEIVFDANGESVILHQGQSTSFEGYAIKLLIARVTEYRPGVLDAGQNNVSYLISRN